MRERESQAKSIVLDRAKKAKNIDWNSPKLNTSDKRNQTQTKNARLFRAKRGKAFYTYKAKQISVFFPKHPKQRTSQKHTHTLNPHSHKPTLLVSIDFIFAYRKRKHIKHIRETISQYTNHTNKNVNNWTNHYIHCQYGKEKTIEANKRNTKPHKYTPPPSDVKVQIQGNEPLRCTVQSRSQPPPILPLAQIYTTEQLNTDRSAEQAVPQ